MIGRDIDTQSLQSTKCFDHACEKERKIVQLPGATHHRTFHHVVPANSRFCRRNRSLASQGGGGRRWGAETGHRLYPPASVMAEAGGWCIEGQLEPSPVKPLARPYVLESARESAWGMICNG